MGMVIWYISSSDWSNPGMYVDSEFYSGKEEFLHINEAIQGKYTVHMFR